MSTNDAILILFLCFLSLLPSCATMSTHQETSSPASEVSATSPSPSPSSGHSEEVWEKTFTDASPHPPLLSKEQKDPLSAVTSVSEEQAQWFEFLIKSRDPLGAYSFEIQVPLSLFSSFQDIEGGNSPYFLSPPVVQSFSSLGKIEVSGFHGSVEGPQGLISVCFVKAPVSLENFSTQITLLTTPQQTPIQGELQIRPHFKAPLPRPTFLSAGSPWSVEVFLTSSVPLGGYAFEVVYDPQIVFIERIEGGQEKHFASAPFSAPSTYRKGRTKINAFHPETTGKTGRISICRIFFKSLGKGRSLVEGEHLECSDREGRLIAAVLEFVPESLEVR